MSLEKKNGLNGKQSAASSGISKCYEILESLMVDHMTIRVFISYSWTTSEHEDWVILLANRLVHDGVDVILDKWDLKTGQDKYVFMESMVTATDIDKVLIICDKKYVDRANSRTGGVGTETLIITPQVYQSAAQEKFIPIVVETDENGTAFLPNYLAGRIYIDLSVEEIFEENYEWLLRILYNRPSHNKPKLGSPPTFLFVENSISYKTAVMSRGLEAQLNKHPDRINTLTRDFLSEFYQNLLTLHITPTADNWMDYGKQVAEILHQYLLLRNDYLLFVDTLTKNSVPFDADQLIHFFEKLPLLLAPQTENLSSWNPREFEHNKFIIYELFLYTVSIGLKNENYALLENILHSKYLVKERGRSKVEPESYPVFDYYFELMDVYYRALHGRDFQSVQADVLIKRVPDFMNKDHLVNGDMLCYHIGQLNNFDWFPRTYIYQSSYSSTYDFFTRLISKRHFDKVNGLLGFDTIEELKIKLTLIGSKEKDQGYSSGRGRMPSIDQYLKTEDVGTSK